MQNATEESTALAADIPALAISPEEPDHVFVLIETAMRKHKLFLNVYDTDDNDPRSRAAWAALEQHCAKAEWGAIETIAACKPNTVAGVAAVLRFFAACADRDAIVQRELMEALLGNMATALDRIEAGCSS